MILRRFVPRSLVAAALMPVVAVTLAACARLPAAGLAAAAPVAVETFVFERDTFAFRNDVRVLNPGATDLYANYCFVLARAVRQFFSTARFDPRAPRLDHAGYVERVREVVARPPWAEPLPETARVRIPGYANLREFSREQEAAVKEGLGGRFWTLVHWTNWRVTFPVSAEHQEGVLQEIIDDLAAGRLPQLLVTNWPTTALNHTVIAYAVRDAGDGLELTIWDPNEPERPGLITFDRRSRRFQATRMFATEPAAIRVFRMYHSRFL